MLARVALNRTSALRAASMVRFYTSSNTEGAVSAGSKAFNKREKHQEERYMRQVELQQLKALREKLEAAQEALRQQEQKYTDELAKATGQ